MGYTPYTLDKNFFKQETPETFYVAGFLAADGWLYEAVKFISPVYILGISLKEEDKNHIEKIQSLLRSNHKIYKRIVKNSKRNIKYKDTITYTLQLSFTEKWLLNDLKKFNITYRKSLSYKMPRWLKNHKYINYFLLGYFDGDGSISFDKIRVERKEKTPQARMHLRGTVEFLKDFHNILYKHCKLQTKNKTISIESNIGSLQYTGNNNVGTILDFLYANPVIYLDRKYERYKTLQNIRNRKI